jgi:hypothetical protein
VNINMLRDLDNDPGFYAAGCGLADRWPGATLLNSADDGASYTALATFTNQATLGTATNVLGDFAGGNIADEINRLTVVLTHGELASVSYAAFVGGAQAAVIGSEIIYFRDAALNLNGSYTLSGLLRGRRGSEYAMATHAANERFVLVNDTTLKRIPDTTASIGLSRLYKAVTAGMTLADTASQAFVNAGAGLKPYAAVHLGGGRDAAGNVTLQWERRSRVSGEWRDGVDVPIGEDSQAYAVEVWDSARSTLKRTISGLAAPTASYSAAEQSSDFGGVQATVYFSVYQLSAIVGRGYEARGQI